MIDFEIGLPHNEHLDRYDGSRWRLFELPSGGKLVLTARGSELLSFNPTLRHTLLDYRREARSNQAHSARQWFRAGGNSDIYQVGQSGMVIKEASTAHSVWFALDRMDYLEGICRRHLPSYIRVPDHYGVLIPGSGARQYLLMEKVNEGLTVADLKEGVNGVDMPDWMKKLAIKEFEGLETKVKEAIDKATGRNFMPKNLLPDWDAGNVIVDQSTPRKDMPFTFWIIDQ